LSFMLDQLSLANPVSLMMHSCAMPVCNLGISEIVD